MLFAYFLSETVFAAATPVAPSTNPAATNTSAAPCVNFFTNAPFHGHFARCRTEDDFA
jgi:hypothetical protein